MSNAALVIELLTRAHRAGFQFHYTDGADEPTVTISRAPAPPDDLEPELRHIIDELRRHRPDVLEVLNRTCTHRRCDQPSWIREHGTDLPWCRRHAGIRGLQLLTEERPDLFPSRQEDAA